MIGVLTWPADWIEENFEAICSGQYDIPRVCVVCQREGREGAIVSHGTRERTFHSRDRKSIKVRRGQCNEPECRVTYTFLPCFVRPYHHYSVETQAGALASYFAESESKSGQVRGLPSVWDPDRSPEESTVRRWFNPLGERWLLKKVESLVERASGGVGGEAGSGGWRGRETKSTRLKVLFKIWERLVGAARSARRIVLENLRLSGENCLMFLLLLWYEKGKQVTVVGASW